MSKNAKKGSNDGAVTLQQANTTEGAALASLSGDVATERNIEVSRLRILDKQRESFAAARRRNRDQCHELQKEIGEFRYSVRNVKETRRVDEVDLKQWETQEKFFEQQLRDLNSEYQSIGENSKNVNRLYNACKDYLEKHRIPTDQDPRSTARFFQHRG